MSAPIGNTFWKARAKSGRDKIFSTPEQLWQAATEYFKWCDKHPWYRVEQLKKPTVIKDKDGNEKLITMERMPTARPYTITGICIFLDINTLYFRDFKAAILKKEVKEQIDQDFSRIITRIEEIIYNQKFEGAAIGAFKENLIARELGLKDHQTLSGPNGELISPTVIVNPVTTVADLPIIEKEDEE